MPSLFPCSPVIRECSWKETQIEKKNVIQKNQESSFHWFFTKIKNLPFWPKDFKTKFLSKTMLLNFKPSCSCNFMQYIRKVPCTDFWQDFSQKSCSSQFWAYILFSLYAKNQEQFHKTNERQFHIKLEKSHFRTILFPFVPKF